MIHSAIQFFSYMIIYSLQKSYTKGGLNYIPAMLNIAL